MSWYVSQSQSSLTKKLTTILHTNVVSQHNSISILSKASEAPLVSHLCSAPLQGRLRQCKLGFEHAITAALKNETQPTCKLIKYCWV